MYVKITSGSVDTFPYSMGQLRRDNPQTSFPRQIPHEMLATYGVYPVTIDSQPSYDDRTQIVLQNAMPTGSDNTWTLGWTTTSKTAEEIQQYDEGVAASNRNKRNNLIAETDWWASVDLTMTAEQTAYRQALRDITTHSNWPNLSDDDWPVKP